MNIRKFNIAFFLVFLQFLVCSNNILAQDYKQKLKDGAVELIDKRTESSKTFKNPDGSYTTLLFTYRIHREVQPGVFEEADDLTDLYKYVVCAYRTPNLNYFLVSPPSSIARFGYWNAGGFAEGAYRNYFWWNTSPIPSGATISSTSLDLYRSLQCGSPQVTNYYLKHINTNWGSNPPEGNAQGIWSDCGDGVTYFSTNSSQQSFDFISDNSQNSAFKNDLQSRLSDRWMALGFLNSDESNCIYFKGYSNDILIVNWTAPQQLCVTPLNWAAPSTGGSQQINVTNCGGGVSFAYHIINVPGWLTTAPPGWIQTPNPFTITASPNYTGCSRNGTVTVEAQGINGSPQTVNISQSPAATIILPNQEVQGLELYVATNWIQANTFVVGQGGNVPNLTLKAGNYVELNPGFTALEGCNFEASIWACQGPLAQLNALSSDDRIRTTDLEKNVIHNTRNVEVPTENNLFQNYPNPFNLVTSIKYALREDTYVELKIYDLLGREVATLVNEYQIASVRNITWNGKNSLGDDISSGLYFYKLVTNNYTKILKMIVIK